jgi:hypothetical protein
VYADTEFYKKSSGVPTFTGNWVRQLKTIAKDHSKVSFFRVAGDTTAEIRELLGVPNLAHITLAEFQHRVVTGKI